MNRNRTALAMWFGVFLLLAFIIIGTEKAHSTVIDSTQLYKTILFIGHFNTDHTLDTLIGTADTSRKFIPRYIAWGKDTTFIAIPESLKVARTEIQYPNWKYLKVSCNIDKINSDTLNDLVFINSGKIQLDSTHYKDTAVAFAVFGKSGFDTVRFVNTALLNTVITNPYIGMKLLMGVHFTDCAVRDFSGISSYKVNKIIDPPPPPIVQAIIEEKNPDIKLFPNPAIYYTNVELNSIKPGRYRLQIISSNGEQLKEQLIDNNETTSITNMLDIKDLASGTYFLRITCDTKVLGIYPFVVLH